MCGFVMSRLLCVFVLLHSSLTSTESSSATWTMVLHDVIQPMRALFVTFLPAEHLHFSLGVCSL